VKAQGRKAQIAAIESPECFDMKSSQLLAWWEEDKDNREKRGTLAKEAA